MHTIDSIDELRFRLSGGLHTPGEAAYEEACALYNGMVRKRPRLVARCAAPDDVVAALAHAREHGLDVAVRAGGHSVTGICLAEDGLVLDMRDMADVEVDPVRGVAKVGGGAVWAQVDTATQRHGLATTGGRVSSTGVAGLTLGGGSGWLERKHGFACDNLVGVELVTADGRLVRASADENPELLWAHRGGGGNFGVVTALEFAVHPVGPEVLAGLVIHPSAVGDELLATWRDVMRDAPDGLSLAFAYLTVAPDDPDLVDLRGQTISIVAGMYAGPVAEGEEAMRAIREFGSPILDAFEPVPYADFQCSLDDPPGYRNYWSASHMADLPDDLIASIHSYAADMPGSLPQLFIPAWGGAVGRVGDEHSPLRGRDTAFVVHPLLMWDDPADDEAAIAWGRDFGRAMAVHATGGAYLNFSGEDAEDRVRAQYGDANYERLGRIKAEWDPADVFHGGGHVPPAA